MAIDFTDRDKVREGMELVDSMTDEELNTHIDYIRHTLGERKRRKSAVVRGTMKVGTRVRLEGRRKPQYLTGLTGTIAEIRQTRVTIQLDCGPVGKFRDGRVITDPGSLTILPEEK